jgi:plasmid stability protein
VAQLVVRNSAESVNAGLPRRAERHGRSVEAEVREILQAAIGDESGAQVWLGRRIAARFGYVGVDEEIR